MSTSSKDINKNGSGGYKPPTIPIYKPKPPSKEAILNTDEALEKQIKEGKEEKSFNKTDNKFDEKQSSKSK